MPFRRPPHCFPSSEIELKREPIFNFKKYTQGKYEYSTVGTSKLPIMMML